MTGEVETNLPVRVLLAASDLDEIKILWPLAQAIANEQGGELFVLHSIVVPEETSLSESAATARQRRDTLSQFVEEMSQRPAQVKVSVRVDTDVWADIWETVRQEAIDILVIGWQSVAMPQAAIERMSDRQLATPPCNIVIVRLGRQVVAQNWWSNIKKVLLPVRGDPSNSLVLRIANTLADATDSAFTILHSTSHISYDVVEDWNLTGPYMPGGSYRLTRSIVRTGGPITTILEEAKDYHAVVMGSTRWPSDPDDWSGPIVSAVADQLQCTLIIVKERSPQFAQIIEGQDIAVREKTSLSVLVDKWFAENTFHSEEFSDLERLLALKEERGVTISLGLPALNEEKTVGKVISVIKNALMDTVPLLDEIVLIDSNSRDRTRQIAASLGVPAYIHQHILPQYGARSGKGEALWKSLYVLRGDIIVWIDTDIQNPDPRFVYGIIGPLLLDDSIQYVKGFYRRPIWEAGKLRPGGGGRVTELTCRPLFNLLFPHLSGIIQPLSGEYAGRRSALEQVPFFCGYGVETGLLIDIFERFGLRAIAQTDLLERIHRNQPLPSLSKMSFAILQVILRRLEDRHNLNLMEEANKTMKLVNYRDNGYSLEEDEIHELERPPIVQIPEYRDRRKGILSN